MNEQDLKEKGEQTIFFFSFEIKIICLHVRISHDRANVQEQNKGKKKEKKKKKTQPPIANAKITMGPSDDQIAPNPSRGELSQDAEESSGGNSFASCYYSW